MTCEEFYKSHDPFVGDGDRCSVSEIEARTASAVALLGTTTTIFGVINLIWTGWLIKSFGVKAALVQQTVWPSVRLCCQIIGVTLGAGEGMMMIQITQFICMFGGPAGYLLALNTYVTEVAEPSQRTAAFGQLQGAVMFGTAFGYLLGGQSGDIFGIRRPYEIAFFLMIISTLYTLVFLPYVAPSKVTDETIKKKSLSSYFGPAKMFLPQKFRLPNGSIYAHWGIFLLGAGVFWGVLATGFIPVLIQMYATNAFGFRPTENGYLMSFNSIIRGLFLTFVFPKIISMGRIWFTSKNATVIMEPQQSRIPTTAEDLEAVPGLEAQQEPTTLLTSVDANHGSAFDLFFLKWSLVVDGLLTGCAAFSRQGWHIYLAAFLLPLASGSAAAAKGVMMEMCEPSQRADALSAITLVEMIATVSTSQSSPSSYSLIPANASSTVSIFGAVFAALAEIGKPHLVFICNAGVAVFAVFVLAFSRFPPAGAIRIVDVDAVDQNGVQAQVDIAE
jgi:MFS family permease